MDKSFISSCYNAAAVAASTSTSSRPRCILTRCTAGNDAGASQMPAVRPIVIKSPPHVRNPAPPPQPAPIEHSAAYLLRSRRQLENGEADPLSRQRELAEEAFTGSAVDWMLRKADASLDQIEEDPPAYARALYDLSTGPVGTTASKGVTAAAAVTVQIGAEALKAAVPVGKWVLAQSLKLAVGAVSRGITGGGKAKDTKK